MREVLDRFEQVGDLALQEEGGRTRLVERRQCLVAGAGRERRVSLWLGARGDHGVRADLNVVFDHHCSDLRKLLVSEIVAHVTKTIGA